VSQNIIQEELELTNSGPLPQNKENNTWAMSSHTEEPFHKVAGPPEGSLGFKEVCLAIIFWNIHPEIYISYVRAPDFSN
jgi:hypothetical protein